MSDRIETHRSPTREIPAPTNGGPVGRPVRGPVGRPAEPDDMRREIEATRARISGTLDALEGRLVHEKEQLVRKKDEVWAKATLKGVRRKVAEEPFRSMAIAFVAGYVIAAIRD